MNPVCRMFERSLPSTCTTNCERPLIGNNSVGELAGNANITMGRWNGGTTGGIYFSLPTTTFSNSQGFHYVVGRASSTFPVGQVLSHALFMSTLPTKDSGGAVGIATTGNIKVDYNTDKVAVDITVTIGGVARQIVSAGGLTTPARLKSASSARRAPSRAVFLCHRTGLLARLQRAARPPSEGWCQAAAPLWAWYL